MWKGLERILYHSAETSLACLKLVLQSYIRSCAKKKTPTQSQLSRREKGQ